MKKINKKINKFSVALIVLLVILYLVINIFVPKINLNGKGRVDLTVGKEYKDPGVKAYLRFKDISNKISTSNNLNEDKLGSYYIDYYTYFGPVKIIKRRVINVVDNIKPKIVLDMENDNYYVCPGKKLENIKYSAIDNYDGDITKKVKVDLNEKDIIFKVKDKSKNETIIKKDIFYVDIKKPDIKLNDGDITISRGSKYEEKGATAIDDCDGDISNKIKITNNVDSNTLGKYDVIYTISDANKNEATIKRVVTVVEPSRGVIYLTFDDGPNSGTTDVILNILKEEGVKATFFVTNKGPDELIKREFDEGHSIALHTATHDYSYLYSSDENYFNDLRQVSDRVERITGKKSMLIRFPGGSSNTISRRYSPGIMSRLTVKVKEQGYHYFDWDISSGDAAGGRPSPDTIYNNVINSVGPNKRNIVLMHDIKTYTRDALRNIIRWGKSNGYRFAAIDMNTEEHHQRVNN